MINDDVRYAVSRKDVVGSRLVEIDRNDALCFIENVLQFPIEKNSPQWYLQKSNHCLILLMFNHSSMVDGWFVAKESDQFVHG